jgi:predicted house-cleaning noncanonical NTP pyrophosphatase (MazG superfamily)
MRKAVRDGIHSTPAEGWKFSQVGDDEFLKLLLIKLHEEADEVAEAVQSQDRVQLMGELADVISVAGAIAVRFGISSSGIENAGYSKEEARGGFYENWVGVKDV